MSARVSVNGDDSVFVDHQSDEGARATLKIDAEYPLRLQTGADYGEASFAGLQAVTTAMLGVGGSAMLAQAGRRSQSVLDLLS